MNIFIRVDASVELGTGHLMRCLTLANRLKKDGKEVSFICRRAKGDCIQLVKDNGFEVYMLPAVELSLWVYTKIEWQIDATQTIDILSKFNVQQLVVDHYSLDEKWEKQIRPFTKEVMVIDDLADRKHECDVLLDQNYYLNLNARYEGLVPKHTKLLLGPKYALLRNEFIEAKKRIKPFNGTIEQLFIFFGGSDPTNETEKVLRAIKPLILQYKLSVDVVVGNSNPNKEVIKKICTEIENVSFHCQISNISQLMEKADLAIGAGGATMWERAFLQLPTIVIAVAENQIEVVEATAKLQAILYIGTSNLVTEDLINQTLSHLLDNKDKVLHMKRQCGKVIS